MALFETVDLCQRFEKRDILKNVNLKIDKGEVLGLIGPTGAGKTTLLRLLDLLDMPASGKIYFDGVDTVDMPRQRLELRQRMAFLLQKPVMFSMSVYDNVACGLRWRGAKKHRTREKVTTLLEMVGLSEMVKRNARTLSSGEAQRVALARALAIEPDVLLLDEPTANLDPVSTARIEDLINSISRRNGTTVIMSTYDMSQGQRLADRLAVLIDGEIKQTGNWNQVFHAPQNKDVARFVGAENILDGVVVASSGGVATIAVGSRVVQSISDYSVPEKVSACIRPEDITLALSRFLTSARNTLPGKVTQIAWLGPLCRVNLDCGFPLVALVTRQSAEELQLRKGSQVYASVKATAVHVIKREGEVREQ